ncbi:hypothetical protein PFISCL1PPCAC_21914, partial [Pristionchus fissidentatus]
RIMPSSSRFVSNMNSCSQQGTFPFTAIVVLFTFCSLTVTYVLNSSTLPRSRAFLTETMSVSISSGVAPT